MGSAIDALLRRMARSGLRRGMAGEHWAWLVVAGAAFVLRRARRRDDPVTSIQLEAGDRYLLSLHGPKDPVARSAR